MKKVIALLLLTFSISFAYSQQYGLYTLYAVKDGTTANLVDTSSNIYHTWTFSSSKRTVYSTYLDDDKNLWRTYKPTGNSGFTGPIHGGIQKLDWDGNTLWDFTYYSNGVYTPHHDICPMPNGNILLICYEYKSSTEATAAGSTGGTYIYSEKIVEMQQTGTNSYSIVWEWSLWDHMCQDVSAGTNYVSNTDDHPELMNINYSGGGDSHDKYHMNGIDYNEDLDQIVVSMHNMDAVFVIDHSTTTSEAASHLGGNSGMGGDFLYRWGNPASYGASGTTQFDVIHDAHWISSDNPNYPDYLAAFNNEGGSGTNSAVTIWLPPYNGYNYTMTPGVQTPTSEDYQYNASWGTSNEGNSEQLPNGNMLLCRTMGSTIYEINSSGSTIWTYSVGGMMGSSHAYRFTKCEIRGPIASITADTDICLGDAVTLTGVGTSVTESSPSYQYAWNSTNGFSSTSPSDTDTPSSTTTYNVTITNTSLGCWDTASVTVNVHPLPATPVITDYGYYLSSTSATTYQWYLNGSIISGATSQDYTPTASGDYTVVIGDINGCTATSAAVTFVYTGIEQNNNEPISIMPNPTNGVLNLTGSIISEGNYTVEIFNTFGMKIMQVENQSILDLSFVSNGIYYLIVRSSDSRTETHKVVLNK